MAATLPHRPPQLFVQDAVNPTARGHVLAGPDDATGEWWYWDDARRPIADAGKPAPAADQIIDALTGPGRSGGDARRERPARSPTSPSRPGHARALVNRGGESGR